MRAACPRAILAVLVLGVALPAAALAEAPPETEPAGPEQRVAVDASAPVSRIVTIYRDPGRTTGERMERDWPQGFALITETRRVTLPPGRSTIRFIGVAEGMIAVSAIVSGLPGGTIEQNRNADLLSPAALVDGSLGNRVTITRTDPATGAEQAEQAVIRTRADGGLVLETEAGFEAVRCAGLPERLSFDRVPAGLSSEPVFSIDTFDATGGTYTVTLSYLSWGFDWEAHYVATLQPGVGRNGAVRFDLVSWLTLLNDNGQSFADAELLVVAGEINVVSNYQQLAAPPRARPLALTCYPLGSTAAGSPFPDYLIPPQPVPAPMAPPMPPPMMMARADAQEITVTGGRVLASEENLGDLKLFRVPLPVTVAARGLKQVAFLDRQGVEGVMFYRASCTPDAARGETQAAQVLIEARNSTDRGLGTALPAGQVAVFEASSRGPMLLGEVGLRDHASGQEVELPLGTSAQVQATCRATGSADQGQWQPAELLIINANPHPITMRARLGSPLAWEVRGLTTRLRDGQHEAVITVPGNGSRTINWQGRRAGS